MEDAALGGSNLNPLAFAFLLIMSVAVLSATRQNAVGALLVTAAIIPLGQQLVVFGLHFHFLRILLLVGLCRVFVRHEAVGFKLNKMDKLFLAWAVVGIFFGMLTKPGAEVFGAAYNSLGTYFLIRIVMQRPDEIVGHLRIMAVVVLIIAASMCLEALTHKNLFSIFGGVPEILQERDDRVRCQGPFRSPILAGTFAATLFPLMVGLWFQTNRKKLIAVLGILGCVVATILSNSSGPLLCLLAALIGLGLWRVRDRMQILRRGTVALIIGLALMMKAPVWYLIARISDLVGGGGWHRAYVIDLAVNHVSEWWLAGTARTVNWAPDYQVLLVDPNNIDITNHYVVQGINGGIWMLGLFLGMIVVGFKVVGTGARAAMDSALRRKMTWAVGVSLAAHCTAFISVSYFDQIAVFWFWLLAVISSLSLHLVYPGTEHASTNHAVNDDADSHRWKKTGRMPVALGVPWAA